MFCQRKSALPTIGRNLHPLRLCIAEQIFPTSPQQLSVRIFQRHQFDFRWIS
jgi:hypothetical protein